jgi:hypothetical protein
VASLTGDARVNGAWPISLKPLRPIKGEGSKSFLTTLGFAVDSGTALLTVERRLQHELS